MPELEAKPLLQSKTSIQELIYEYKGIQLPLLQMTDPYYPHSKLAKSIFSGYYILFFMYSVIFMITYPLLNFLQGKDLFGLTIIKLVQTNILWDVISTGLFVFMTLVFTQISQMTRRNATYLLIGVVFVSYLTSGVFIVRTYKMYLSDRIFIIVLNWGVCSKTITYILDKKRQKEYHPSSIEWTKVQKQKNMNRLSKRLIYLISPLPSYQKFVMQHNPSLPIHLKYLFTKFFVTFLCLIVNNILIVKFIEPACKDNISFLALVFKLIPLTFYINMVLYYMVLDNVLAALSQFTKINNRILYLDWWNAETISQFLDRWCLVINFFTDAFLPNISTRTRNTLHVAVMQMMLLAVFGQSFNPTTCVGFMFINAIVYFLADNRLIQNNMVVHMLCMSFTPVMIALEVKLSIFSEGIF